ncbi:MAG: type III-A CRISPR-associated RAMP protein Csm4 [Candidatus Humimicrobiaceae bacterium]
MNDYVLKLKLKSPIITPLDADTLFGHICWAFRYLKGNRFIENFLNEFEEKPKFLISDGFPEDCLPNPVLPNTGFSEMLEMLKDERISALFGFNKNSKKDNFLKLSEEFKIFRKLSLIPKNIFLKTAIGLNEKNLFIEMTKYINEKKKNGEATYSFSCNAVEVMHNAINRLNSSVSGPGQLFSQDEIFYSKDMNKDMQFEIYFKIFNTEIIKNLKEAFDFICINGYGKDKSTGKGLFEIVEDFKKTEIFSNNNGDYFMSLSPFVPDENFEPLFYNIKTKFGKVFNDTGEFKGSFNPFKKPLVMLGTGSIFRTKKKEPKIKEFIQGNLLSNLSNNLKIKHYAFSYPIKINIV